MAWKVSDLGDVCTLYQGIAINAKTRQCLVEKSDLPLLRIKDLKNNTVEQFIDPNNYPTNALVDETDILYTRTGSLGLVFRGRKGILHNNSFKVVPSKEICKEYMFHWLQNPVFKEQIVALSSKAAQPDVTHTIFKKQKISFPQISEQKRIVALLDTLFADLEQTSAKTEQSLKNASELFDSYLQQVFSQKGDGWVDGKMTDICEINTKLIDPKEDEYLDLLHIGAGNIVSNTGELIKVKTAKEEGLISGKFVFDSSMILYSKIRPYLMKVCRPEFTGLCSADIYPLSPIKGTMDKHFLFYLLLSKDFTDYAISGSGRAGMPKVNRTHLFNYSVSIPPIEKQREYVIKINQVASQSQELERIYTSKLTAIIELKKSILQKAFNGELTKLGE